MDTNSGSSSLNGSGGNEVYVMSDWVARAETVHWAIRHSDDVQHYRAWQAVCSSLSIYCTDIDISNTTQRHSQYMYCTHTAYEHADIARIAHNPYLLHYFLREYHT